MKRLFHRTWAALPFRRGRYAYPAPERPIYADARWGGLTLAVRVKVIVVLFLLVLALMMWWFNAWVNESNARRVQRIADQTRTNQVLAQLGEAQKDLAADQALTAEQAKRLAADEAAIGALAAQNKADVRELACILVSQAPDDPAKPLIHMFRVKYGCPPFNPDTQGVLTAAGGAQSPATGSAVPVGPPGSVHPTATATRPPPGHSSPPATIPTCLLLPTLCLPNGLPLPPLPILTMLPTLKP